jgi:hypothetical protein
MTDTAIHNTQEATDEVGAAIVNAILFRIKQTGRDFVTAADYKTHRLMVQATMALQDVAPAEHLGRPQTLPQHTRISLIEKMEKAMQEHQTEQETTEG